MCCAACGKPRSACRRPGSMTSAARSCSTRSASCPSTTSPAPKPAFCSATRRRSPTASARTPCWWSWAAARAPRHDCCSTNCRTWLPMYRSTSHGPTLWRPRSVSRHPTRAWKSCLPAPTSPRRLRCQSPHARPPASWCSFPARPSATSIRPRLSSSCRLCGASRRAPAR